LHGQIAKSGHSFIHAAISGIATFAAATHKGATKEARTNLSSTAWERFGRNLNYITRRVRFASLPVHLLSRKLGNNSDVVFKIIENRTT
jgi:hypothetical protein